MAHDAIVEPPVHGDRRLAAHLRARLAQVVRPVLTRLKGRRQLLRLWKAQDGICPVCHQKITEVIALGLEKCQRVAAYPPERASSHSALVTLVLPRQAG